MTVLVAAIFGLFIWIGLHLSGLGKPVDVLMDTKVYKEVQEKVNQGMLPHRAPTREPSARKSLRERSRRSSQDKSGDRSGEMISTPVAVKLQKRDLRLRFAPSCKPKGALVMFVQNAEYERAMQTVERIENWWNHEYQYPWVFFGSEPFSSQFKAITANMTSSNCSYAMIPRGFPGMSQHGGSDSFGSELEIQIALRNDENSLSPSRRDLATFYKHSAMDEFDWYWKIVPGAFPASNIDFDVFRFMEEHNLAYGIPGYDTGCGIKACQLSIERQLRNFIAEHPGIVFSRSGIDWLFDKHSTEYGYLSSPPSEMGNISFFRGQENDVLVDWASQRGWFDSADISDGCIHALGAALFLPEHQLWSFGNIRFQEDNELS